MSQSFLRAVVGPWVVKQSIPYATLTDKVAAARRDRELAYAVIVRGKKMRTRQGVFDEISAALQFPYYFGENWNAFNDCIHDLDWLPPGAITVWVLDAVELLRDSDPDELRLLMGILNETGVEFSKGNEFRPARPLHFVLQALPTEMAMLDDRVRGIQPSITWIEEQII